MYKNQQFRFFVVLTAFFVIFLVGSGSASAAGKNTNFEGGRYFIGTKSYLIKSLFGVQHEFDGGFTADLTTGEVWTLERIFKVAVKPVPLYKISGIDASAAGAASVISDAVYVLQNKDLKPKTRAVLPTAAVGWGIKAIYNNDLLTATSGGKGVNVAVLDTGANVNHPDIADRIKDCKDFTRGPVPRSACEDKNGHGTYLAGIIAADGGWDASGLWGVASEANLLIYKVCRNDGTCWADDVAAALDFATASANLIPPKTIAGDKNSDDKSNSVNIVTLGLGGDIEGFVLKNSLEAVLAKNILIVAAAGNDGPEKLTLDWPAAYKGVAAVGALAEDGVVPDWSSRGGVEFSAPGVNVESAWSDGAYRFLSGTSAAAAHISGLAAKLWNGSATNTLSNLERISRDIYWPGDDNASGFGLPILARPILSE